MTVTDRMIARIQRRPPDFCVGGPEAPYLRRWWVIPRNRFLNIYLHEFCRDDDDRALHDHPWFSLSFLLRGFMVEETIKAGGVHQRKILRPGTIRFRLPWTAHRIEVGKIIASGPVTLFLTGPVVRVWGFHCRNGWVPWRQFVDDRDSGVVGRGCGEIE